jgi:radial spoke head protein 4A
LINDVKVFEWAGVGFSEYEALLLMKSLKQLASTTAANNIRLWGKILGTEKDYYIAEGSWEGGVDEEAEKPADFEARGSGVNKFVYWVTNNPLEAWTLLPDLYPKDIQAARDIKVLFTGDIERKIITNPFFFK